LSYDGAFFRASRRRVLLNGGTDPVTRYLMRISVDRYPGQPERSNALYRARPLTWDENDRGRFPLYPGQTATIAYSYTVDDNRWGPWFQRAVRLPTHHMSVDLAFPATLDPVVWGTETT
jgi:hypothetical protein